MRVLLNGDGTAVCLGPVRLHPTNAKQRRCDRRALRARSFTIPTAWAFAGTHDVQGDMRSAYRLGLGLNPRP